MSNILSYYIKPFPLYFNELRKTIVYNDIIVYSYSYEISWFIIFCEYELFFTAHLSKINLESHKYKIN